MKKAADPHKDQSYFLWTLTQRQLAAARFPLGDTHKKRTRQLARRLRLGVADKPATQDICFLGGRNYRDFVRARTPSSRGFREGPVVDPDGNPLGRHRGIAHYTVGQRKGLRVAAQQPLYVTRIDAERNVVVAGTGEEARTRTLWVKDVNWIAFDAPPARLRAGVKVRYRQPEQPAVVLPRGTGAQVVFDRAQWPVAGGQRAVFYAETTVLGGGVIEQ